LSINLTSAAGSDALVHQWIPVVRRGSCTKSQPWMGDSI
jgi:hypothetical protein